MNQQLDSEFIEQNSLNEADDGTRFLHACIDNVILYVLNTFLISFVVNNTSILDEAVAQGGFSFKVLSIGLILRWFYFFLQENFLNGRTIGKLFTRCRVVMNDGEPATAKALAIRTSCRFIPFEALTIFSGTILHDRLASTTVISLK